MQQLHFFLHQSHLKAQKCRPNNSKEIWNVIAKKSEVWQKQLLSRRRGECSSSIIAALMRRKSPPRRTPSPSFKQRRDAFWSIYSSQNHFNFQYVIVRYCYIKTSFIPKIQTSSKSENPIPGIFSAKIRPLSVCFLLCTSVKQARLAKIRKADQN